MGRKFLYNSVNFIWLKFLGLPLQGNKFSIHSLPYILYKIFLGFTFYKSYPTYF